MRELSMHIPDLAQNSIVAGASAIEISVAAHRVDDVLTIQIRDNGRGMSVLKWIGEYIRQETDAVRIE